MFALIRYDGSLTYDVIKTSFINGYVGKKSLVKYGGCKYSVDIIHKNSNEVVLQDLAFQLNSKLPTVVLCRINDKKQKSEESTIVERKQQSEECSINDNNTSLLISNSDHYENDQLMPENCYVRYDGFLETVDDDNMDYDENVVTDSGKDNTNYQLTKENNFQRNDIFETTADQNNENSPNIPENNEDIAKVDYRSIIVPHSEDHCKKYFCFYCSKRVTNLGRHLVTIHKNEGDVIGLLRYPKGHPSRKNIIGDIRKRGQFVYNTTDINAGTLHVTRRPSKAKQRTANHYVPCKYCKQFYSVLSLRVHIKRCSDNKSQACSKNNIVESRKCVLNINPLANRRLAQQVLPKCKRDNITEIVAFDELCIIYGNKLVNKYKEQRHNFMIRSRLRSIGNFLFQYIQVHPETTSLREILDPSYYENIVEIVNKVAGLDDHGRYAAPSTAYNLGLQLKVLASLYEAQCIKEKNLEKRGAVRDLLTLMNDGFQVDINKTVSENQVEQKRHKKVILPTKEDILALKKFLNEGLVSSYSKLLQNVIFSNWRDLAGFTLISLQLFNRRRAGEIERILMKDFYSYEFVSQFDEAYQDLNTNLKKIASSYARFYIRGKLNRNVPVLLNREMITYIEVLLKYRHKMGIVEENPYVFGMPGDQTNHLRACNLMRKFSTQCGAPNPNTLRGTELRKQIATACTLYNLPDLLVDDVAKHLGHHVDIHKNIYRQSTAKQIPSMVEILKRAMGDTEDIENDYKENFVDNNMPQTNVLPPINMGSITQDSSDFVNSTISMSNVTVPSQSVAISDEEYFPSRSPTPELTAMKKRVSWSKEERQTIVEKMDWMIKNKVVPSYKQCIELKAISPCLEKRTPPQIKSFVAYESKKLSRPGAKGTKRHYWTPEEKQVVRKNFHKFLQEKQLPSLCLCSQVISDNPILKSRSPEALKAYINNLNKKK